MVGRNPLEERLGVSALPLASRRLDPDHAARHRSRLRRMAWAMCGSPELAEDLVQETYLRVLARPRLLHGDEFAYLARALRNGLANHLEREARRGRPGPELEAVDPADGRRTADPETALMASEAVESIAALPPDKRAVMVAVDVAGMSYAEASDALGVPIGTVMSRLSRARSEVARAIAA
jgi:RNA polymerase sigma-70 factor (ECF subfamily)